MYCTKQFQKAMNIDSEWHIMTSRHTCSIEEIVSQQCGQYSPTLRSQNPTFGRTRLLGAYQRFWEVQLTISKLADVSSIHPYIFLSERGWTCGCGYFDNAAPTAEINTKRGGRCNSESAFQKRRNSVNTLKNAVLKARLNKDAILKARFKKDTILRARFKKMRWLLE